MVADRPPGQGPPGSGALPGTGDHRRALSGAGVPDPAREGRESYRGVYSRAFRRGWARHASSLPKTRVIV